MSIGIWCVTAPDDNTLTVIASDEDEAIWLVMDYCDDPSDATDGYAAKEAGNQCFRWVGFESPSDARNQAQDLYNAGVSITRIQTRTTRIAECEILWEVGTRDEHWCRLGAHVLCGGAR